jgi:hypothetical protein
MNEIFCLTFVVVDTRGVLSKIVDIDELCKVNQVIFKSSSFLLMLGVRTVNSDIDIKSSTMVKNASFL